MRLHSNHRKTGRTLPLTAGVTSGLMGNVVLGILKWGMSHHLSPSLSHYTSAAHVHFGQRVCGVCVSINCNCVYWFFCLLLSHNLNPLHFGWHGNWGLTLQDTRRVFLSLCVFGKRCQYCGRGCTRCCNTDTLMHATLRLRLSYCVFTWHHV